MKNSTDGVDRKQLSSSRFCVWDLPEKSLSICLRLTTVEWLDFEMTRSLALPVEGTEVGGLLLGRVEFDSGRRIIIEGFTPVSCEHRFGTAHHLSSPDKQLLQGQLARWQRGPGSNLYVVGYYRSHHREAFSLDEEDLLLGKEYFSKSVSVFLLIQPLVSRLVLGGFFFCEEGQVEREPTLLFPFSRTRLAQGETIVPCFSPGTVRQPVPAEAPDSEADLPGLVGESSPDRAPIPTGRSSTSYALAGETALSLAQDGGGGDSGPDTGRCGLQVPAEATMRLN